MVSSPAVLFGKGGTFVVQFWVGMRRLTAHWKPLILFEILWKLVTLLVIAPACAGLIQLAIHLAKLKYLTTSNLLQFLRSPWTILLLAVLLLLAALYTLFEIAAVCTCFRQPAFRKSVPRWGEWCVPVCSRCCTSFGAADRFWCCICWC